MCHKPLRNGRKPYSFTIISQYKLSFNEIRNVSVKCQSTEFVLALWDLLFAELLPEIINDLFHEKLHLWPYGNANNILNYEMMYAQASRSCKVCSTKYNLIHTHSTSPESFLFLLNISFWWLNVDITSQDVMVQDHMADVRCFPGS